jgi:hypothetical protein
MSFRENGKVLVNSISGLSHSMYYLRLKFSIVVSNIHYLYMENCAKNKVLIFKELDILNKKHLKNRSTKKYKYNFFIM